MARKKAETQKKKEAAGKKAAAVVTASAERKTGGTGARKAPAAQAAPAVEKTPAAKAAPAVETAPAEKAIPVIEKAPAKEAAPVIEKAPVKEAVPVIEEVPAKEAAPDVEEVPVKEAAPAAEEAPVEKAAEEAPAAAVLPQPRRSVAFIGSECHPFVKTGGLGDVMYALPRVLAALNCDVRVILPRYACIPKKYQDKMIYRGEFYMDLGQTGRNYYVGIMEYINDGVVYDFIDNEEFFSSGNPYVNLVDDIPKYCFFSKAALAALNYMGWIPDIVHCHDWQAALVPVYLRTLFQNTPVGHARSILTIHNLRFQGIYNIQTIL